MSNYKDIHGTTVRNSAGDLSGAATGELFYDSTNRNFSYKFPNVTSTGAWRTSGTTNTSRSGGASNGLATASLFIGGENPGTSFLTITELWNGSHWTEVADLNVGTRQTKSAGTTTSALIAVGYISPANNTVKTESWNGTSWTEVGDLTTARRDGGQAGADNTSSLVFG